MICYNKDLLIKVNGEESKIKFQCVWKNNSQEIRKNEDLHRRTVKSTIPSIQIGADLTTNLVNLSPQLITLHDSDLVRF